MIDLKRNEEVVKEALKRSYFLEKKDIYYCDYFNIKDFKNFESCIFHRDLDEFTDLIRKDAEKLIALESESV
jgi:hypothetical protein